jgi:hypothetical protein
MNLGCLMLCTCRYEKKSLCYMFVSCKKIKRNRNVLVWYLLKTAIHCLWLEGPLSNSLIFKSLMPGLKKCSFYPWKIPRWCYRISDISRSILAFSWVWLLTTPNKQNLASKPLFFWVLLNLSLLLYPPYRHFLFLVAKCQCSSSWFDCDWNTANNGKCSCTFYLLHEIKWNWFEL